MSRIMHGLKTYRRIYRETQEDIAELLKKHRVTVMQMENGKTKVSDQDLQTLAEHYGCSVEDLYIPNPTLTARLESAAVT